MDLFSHRFYHTLRCQLRQVEYVYFQYLTAVLCVVAFFFLALGTIQIHYSDTSNPMPNGGSTTIGGLFLVAGIICLLMLCVLFRQVVEKARNTMRWEDDNLNENAVLNAIRRLHLPANSMPTIHFQHPCPMCTI